MKLIFFPTEDKIYSLINGKNDKNTYYALVIHVPTKELTRNLAKRILSTIT